MRGSTVGYHAKSGELTFALPDWKNSTYVTLAPFRYVSERDLINVESAAE